MPPTVPPFPSAEAPDTVPVRPEERFDESRVAAYLRLHLPDLVGEGPIVFEQFPGGKANLTYLAKAGEVELVLRRPPLGPVAPGSHDMSREHRVLGVLHRAFPKAPRALHLCEDPAVMGKPFLVMERKVGHVVRSAWPEALGGDRERRRVAESLVDSLAELHLVDYRALGLAELGRPDGFVARQVAGWSDRWQRARHREVPVMERLAERLGRSIPSPQRAALLHNDFKLDNAMVDHQGSVVAVLDWDMSTLGDPLTDLGTMLAYWGGGEGVAGAVAADSVLLGEVMRPAEIVERYSAATGLDPTELDWYVALALFRIAVIVQQIHIRWVRGQTSDSRFAELGDLVPEIAEAGLERL